MPHTPSKVQQQTAIGEGLAIACLAMGVSEVPYNKMNLESGFRRAWADWSYRSKFPQVRAELARTDLLHILGKADGRQGATVATWFMEGSRWVPELKQDDWEWEELAGSAGRDFDVDLEGWIALAGPWLEDMGIERR